MYTKIHDSIWAILKRKKISDTGKLLYSYLYTCSHRNLIGLYVIPFAYIASDLDWTSERVLKGYTELFKNGFVIYDEQFEIMFIKDFLEGNPFENLNVEKKAVKVFNDISDLIKSPILKDFLMVLKGLPKPFQTLQERVIQTLSNTETEINTNVFIQNTEKEEETEVYMHEAETAPCKSPIISLILNDKSEYGIMQEQIDNWSELYPAVDILAELRKMKGWLEVNPTKRKTIRGILRFINSWLAKEQDKGGSRKGKENGESSESNRAAKNKPIYAAIVL